MRPIASFTVDHDYIVPGMYISRIDGDVITYDLRTRRPNSDDFMSDLTMHSVEHMVATIIRNSPISSSVLYFGPMGCQTGFYLLVRDEVEPKMVYETLLSVLEDVLVQPEMFGQERKACGNYKNLSLTAAKAECETYLANLRARGPVFTYPKGDLS